MRKINWILIIISSLFINICMAETRVYTQIKEITINNVGKTSQSNKKVSLFENTYVVDFENKTITRIFVKRIDGGYSTEDSTEYTIIGTTTVLDDNKPKSREQLPVIIAVGKPGTKAFEMIQMGEDFLLTSKSSGVLSLMITCAYKRVK